VTLRLFLIGNIKIMIIRAHVRRRRRRRMMKHLSCILLPSAEIQHGSVKENHLTINKLIQNKINCNKFINSISLKSPN
jgi:hypothetical protein